MQDIYSFCLSACFGMLKGDRTSHGDARGDTTCVHMVLKKGGVGISRIRCISPILQSFVQNTKANGQKVRTEVPLPFLQLGTAPVIAGGVRASLFL